MTGIEQPANAGLLVLFGLLPIVRADLIKEYRGEHGCSCAVA